jgi:ABC-type nitrate/sulfonate/bicarbonate transport system ATPase subunit
MPILLTHDMDEVVALAERMMVMRSRPARIVEEIAAALCAAAANR